MTYELTIGLPQILVILYFIVQDIYLVAKEQSKWYRGHPLAQLVICVFVDAIIFATLYWGGFFTVAVCK